MTDIPDEAVEAALDAWIGPSWRDGPPAAIAHSKADMRAALAAADAKRWRPISEAPKNGTPIWGLVGDNLIRMFWHPEFEAFVSAFRRMTMAPGYTIDGKPYKDHSPTVHEPELWIPFVLPLPPPPKEEEG